MEIIAALLVIGALLLILEIFIPGLITGIIGACCLIAAVVLAYWQFGLRTGNAVLFGALVGLIIGTMLWLKYFPDSAVASRLVSKRTIGGTFQRSELLNKTGTAYTSLRPAGTAIIDEQRVDVVTEGAMLEKGTPIKVVQVEGSRIVVRAI